MRAKLAGGLLVLGLWAAVASGQTITNPQHVQFTPSVDHTTMIGGVATITYYELRIYTVGGTTPLATANLGKPAPGIDGMILVDFAPLMAWPLADGSYQARVAAVGPTGEGVSDLSNTFVFLVSVPGCTYGITPSGWVGTAAGGSAPVTVTASSGTCAWVTTTDASWAVPTPASGTGSATITVAIAANTGAARTATLTLAGALYQVSQAAAPPCSYTLSATTLSAPAAGIVSTTTITASLGTCSWTASSGVGWVGITPASGTGSAAVTLTVQPNPGAARQTFLTIAGVSYLVSQAAVGCTYTLSTLSLTLPVAGGTVPVTITPNLGTCTWAVVNTPSWLTVTPGSGMGPTTLTVVVAANSGVARTTTLLIGGQSLAVTQAATSGGTPPQAAQTVIIR